MKKENYCLRINGNNLYFRSLESVKEFFKKCGVEKRLVLGGEDYIELDDLGDIVYEGEKWIYNECMIERGEDYCEIELEKIDFEN
jgi:hypothetical protein